MAYNSQALPSVKRPETDLLLCCARTRFDAEITERIHFLVQKNPDWSYLIREALRHRVVPLFYSALKRICPDAVPDDRLSQLRKYFTANTKRNLILTTKLLKIQDLFETHAVLAVPFKGPVLAESVYKDISLRQFIDLDILVHERDAIRAHDLLISTGYQPEIKLSNDQFKTLINTEDNISLFSDNGGVIVELHWEMSGRYSTSPLYLGDIKERLESVELCNRKIYNLSPEDLLLYLCIHGTKDRWISLESICCVAELIQSRPPINWMLVTQFAREIRCERMLSLGLFMAHDLLGAALPFKVLERIESDHKIKELASTVYIRLFHESGEPSENGRDHRFSSFHMKIRDHLSDKIRYGLRLTTLPTKEDWRLFPLPAFLYFLLYIIRPVRLTVQLVIRLVGKKMSW